MELIVRISTPPSWSRAKGMRSAPSRRLTIMRISATSSIRSSTATRAASAPTRSGTSRTSTRNGATTPSARRNTLTAQGGSHAWREADPNTLIIAGALASTIALQPEAAPPNNALNDLLFLQRMYDAGAAPYFDVMAMQDYGLWSGPTDRRMHPRDEFRPAAIRARSDGRQRRRP